MRLLVVTLVLVLVSLAGPLPASAQVMDDCSHAPTIEALRTCVEHAAHHGHIDNHGVARSLMGKLDAAQAAVDRGQVPVAISLLEAFIREVGAQAGEHIVAEHEAHLRMHAEAVIAGLEG